VAIDNPRPSDAVVFLPGVGAGADSWRYQIENLPKGFEALQPALPGLSDGDEAIFSIDGAVQAILVEFDQRGVDRAHLCGLSLGAVIGLFAVEGVVEGRRLVRG
jgi:3-oxoadipate enol-lactonase